MICKTLPCLVCLWLTLLDVVSRASIRAVYVLICDRALRSFSTDFHTWFVFVGGVGWWSCNLHETPSWTASPSCWLPTVSAASKTRWRHRLRLRIFWRFFYSRAFCTLVCTLFPKPRATFLDAVMTFNDPWLVPWMSFRRTAFCNIVQQVKRNV